MLKFIPLAIAWMAMALTIPAQATTTFTDWTSVDVGSDVAHGVLGSINVTMTGPNLVYGVVDNSFTGFDYPFHCPPLANSDLVEFIGSSPALTYTVSFSSPLQDPVLHISSLASTLEFPGVTLTRLCGQPELTVSGNQITGVCRDDRTPNDASGTVMINGWISSFTFTAFLPSSRCGNLATIDGIDIQIGADNPQSGIGPEPELERGRLRAFPNPSPGPVEFSMNGQVEGRLRIVDIAGRIIRELEFGSGRMAWDGQDAAGQRVTPGLYFAMLTAGGRRVVAKVIIER